MVVLKPLIEELKSFEQCGIHIEKFNLDLPIKLAFVIGDNLSVSELLGFKQTFGPYFICRYCKARYDQIKKKDVHVKELHLNYTISDEVLGTEIEKITSNKQYKSPYGIMFPSPFLKLDINIFQISPPDIFHDLIEGPLSNICQIILKKANYSKIVIDRRMSAIKWVNCKINISANFHLNGKAIQKFEYFNRMIEIFPEWIDNPPEIFQFYHIVRRIMYILYDETQNCGSMELSELIEEFYRFMEKYDLVTPKSHFLTHYSLLMDFYGNLCKFSTMCFERKHRLLKVLIRHSKNFMNVTYSLSFLHQAKMACCDQETDKLTTECCSHNIVRFIMKKDTTSNYEFMKVEKIHNIENKIMIFGDKYITSNTNLTYIKKVIAIEKNVAVDVNDICHTNIYEEKNKK
ncbi:hypothetical protein BLA29_002122 [Euroglyphus maynei]|uniref:Uncharacterized protein n=1 Tax=Euroglyphus maynei TaxID=6958 RepID=A0A1Y3B7W9_EURMA|nr:hypothetical protein BLA29_002122 [Euroglyphus maynei]